MATDYGSDVSTFPSLDVTGRNITGVRCVIEAVARRLVSATGSIWYDPTAGYDLSAEVENDLSPRELRALESRVAEEAEKDDRVGEASVSATLADSKLRVAITLMLIDGTQASPFVVTPDGLDSEALATL